MKKKIAILGSTGSIGKTLIKIIKNNKDDFEIKLLTANKDYKNLFKQAKKFNVKNLIITDQKSFIKLKYLTKDSNIKIYNNFNSLNKIFKNKLKIPNFACLLLFNGKNPKFWTLKSNHFSHLKNLIVCKNKVCKMIGLYIS